MLDFFKICGRITQVSGCSAGGSALEWGSRGREFESRHSDHIDNLLLRVVDFFIFRSLSVLLLLYIILIIGKNRVEVKKNDRTGYNTASQRVRRWS